MKILGRIPIRPGATIDLFKAAKNLSESEVIDALIRTNSEIVLQQLAARPDLSSSIYEKLARSRYESVQYELLFENKKVKDNNALHSKIIEISLEDADDEMIFEILENLPINDKVVNALLKTKALRSDWEIQKMIVAKLDYLSKPARTSIIKTFIEIGDKDVLRAMLVSSDVPGAAKEVIREMLADKGTGV